MPVVKCLHHYLLLFVFLSSLYSLSNVWVDILNAMGHEFGGGKYSLCEMRNY